MMVIQNKDPSVKESDIAINRLVKAKKIAQRMKALRGDRVLDLV